MNRTIMKSEAHIPSQFKRFLNRKLFLCELNPRNEKFSTQCRIVLEKQKHATEGPWIIHPMSSLRKWWESFMVLVSSMVLLIQPVAMAFIFLPSLSDIYSWQDYVRHTLDAFCAIDIIMNFSTAFYTRRGEICFRRKHIYRNYLATSFMCDILSSLPQLYRSTAVNAEIVSSSLFSANMVISGMKLLRITTLLAYLYHMLEVYQITYYTSMLLLIICGTCAMLHWGACIAIVEGSLSAKLYIGVMSPKPSWLIYNDLPNSTATLIYTTAVFKTICIAANSELYDPILNYSVADQVLSSAMWLLFQIIFFAIICFLIQMRRSKSHSQVKYDEMKSQLVHYMKHRDLSISTRASIHTYFKARFKNGYFDKSVFEETVPSKFHNEIVSTNNEYMKQLQQSDIFKGFYEVQILQLTSQLKRETYLPNHIIKGDTFDTSLYFILSGCVVIYTNTGVKLHHLYDGDYFGEIEFVYPEEPRCIVAVAADYTEVYRLERSKLLEASPNTAQLENIKQIACREKGFILNANLKFAYVNNELRIRKDFDLSHKLPKRVE